MVAVRSATILRDPGSDRAVAALVDRGGELVRLAVRDLLARRLVPVAAALADAGGGLAGVPAAVAVDGERADPLAGADVPVVPVAPRVPAVPVVTAVPVVAVVTAVPVVAAPPVVAPVAVLPATPAVVLRTAPVVLVPTPVVLGAAPVV